MLHSTKEIGFLAIATPGILKTATILKGGRLREGIWFLIPISFLAQQFFYTPCNKKKPSDFEPFSLF